MKIYNEENVDLRRSYYFQFFTLVNTTIATTAIIVGLDMNEDDGTCAVCLTQVDCLDDKSMYDFSKNKCNWNDKTQVCSHSDLDPFSVVFIFASIAIALLISVPVRIIVEYVSV
jgi:hypothetical protein